MFNTKTRASFNTHVNYSMFADAVSRDFKTFKPMLKRSLAKIRGEEDHNKSLQITLISSYLGTGMKDLYDAINDMGYIEGSRVRVDFYTASSQEGVSNSFIIREVGAAQEHVENNYAYTAWTRPVVVYFNPTMPTTKPIKNIVFDALTGQHFQID